MSSDKEMYAGVASGMSETRVNLARQILVEEITAHRAVCVNPATCRETANMLAWLAHSMGVTRSDLLDFPRILTVYEINCQCDFCTKKPADA